MQKVRWLGGCRNDPRRGAAVCLGPLFTRLGIGLTTIVVWSLTRQGLVEELVLEKLFARSVL